jgi:cytoskeletal protein CcmA (bactofilin family)
MSTYPSRPSGDFGSTRTAASIGKSLVVKGHITGKEDLVIDGRLEGDVELPENRLTVGQTGHVQGGIRAREIIVIGTVQGNLEASERVEIKKNARVIGDLKAMRPVIEDEAYFKGNVETIRVDAPKQAARPPAPAPDPQPSLIINDPAAAPKPESRRG